MVIKNKRGAEMTIGTIIVIVLGVLVLAFLVWGFSTGWNNLWGKITQYTGGGSNVDTVKQACALACSGMNVNEFCALGRSVKTVDGKSLKGSCANDNVKALGVEACGEISCGDKVYKQSCSDLGGEWSKDGSCAGAEDLTGKVTGAVGATATPQCCVKK